MLDTLTIISRSHRVATSFSSTPTPPETHSTYPTRRLLKLSTLSVFLSSQTLLPPPPRPKILTLRLSIPSMMSLPSTGSFPRVPYNMYASSMDLAASREVPRAQQGLSLSLSSQQPSGYGSFRPEREMIPQPLVTTVSPPRVGGDDVRISGGSPSSASGISNGVNSMQSVLLSSKYLKAAQEVLDEVVSVGKGVIKSASESAMNPNGQGKNFGEPPPLAGGDGQSGGDTSAKRDAELTTAERQEIQMKKAKLLNMLDEVEQRYRQYHHQMQIVISWFEQAAGKGSAKTYTALALQTISKQFRCLKDAILGQIRAASKSLGEDDGLIGKIEGSRLKYVDNQLRQQRALQQLGMIQHNAWRPQRGLPERSVSVLRAWLFEHFLHPYPKDSDKIMLAKQTGLTRSQVSNWFINARVRLWKPMVEEMYTEEVKEQEKKGPEEMTSKSEQNEDSVSKSPVPQEKRPTKESRNKNFIEKQDNPMNQNTNPATLMSTTTTSPTGAEYQESFRFQPNWIIRNGEYHTRKSKETTQQHRHVTFAKQCPVHKYGFEAY
ncbi:BEL1-like homeodomain protein 1 [Abeliophyllum distichum]|uniref:BEL1-like homeodomain protein 1 n=1 Tax=Abeliophyllum distichum TaxID=126358 RepID=A0ABD1VB25_9LAMI